VGAAALLAFLLLASAVAQAGQKPAAGDGLFTPEKPFAAAVDGQIYNELLEVIEAAEMPAWVKMDLLECLPELDGAYRETLLDLFAEGNEAELAAFLNDVYRSGDESDLFLRTAKSGDEPDAGNLPKTSGDDDDEARQANKGTTNNPIDTISEACGCGSDEDDDDDDDDSSGH